MNQILEANGKERKKNETDFRLSGENKPKWLEKRYINKENRFRQGILQSIQTYGFQNTRSYILEGFKLRNDMQYKSWNFLKTKQTKKSL